MADSDIAVVGIAAHLPGAPDPATYWENLVAGHESVRQLTEEEMLEAGVSREAMRRPGYVAAASTLEGTYDFDADFFGLSPKEAGIMDPQHRHFLMACWEALEDAGHVPQSFDGAVGVFAGCGMGAYLHLNVLSNPDLVRDVGLFLLRHTGNDKDFLATRASYALDLRGPSVNVQTACSTSLVATHLAVAHLLSGECDLALAGGVTIEVPHGQGYQYHEGEVLSPDGHCRAFDHRSEGTVFGSGTGVVALRRLDDALDDGDRIYAVIKGTAVNNDGAQKVGYLAPSVDGQAACVAEALAVADVEPGTVDYVECHGTGTPMGDPIEVAALTQAFGTDRDGERCRIGSVKTNIGHLDTAAGVASLIKVALSLHHGAMPPSLNFEAPNPNLELDDGPFAVNDRLTEWPRTDAATRRAGVNSLGVGGTNAFVVLEEAPEPEPSDPTDGWRLLTLSARNRRALDDATARLAAHLRAHPDTDLADVAWTLQVGRHHFDERRVLAARTAEEAADVLEAGDARRLFTHTAGPRPSVAFLLPGGGAQHPGMAAGLHAAEPTFARHVDEGLRLLETEHGLDLRRLLLGPTDDVGADTEALAAMTHQLPLIFIVEHALARLLIERGLTPKALLGHSLGENVAACLAGTISFADCLGLVVLRGRLMDRVEGGAVAVPLPAEEVRDRLDRHGLDVAVLNSPDLTVVSGPRDALATLVDELAAEGVEAMPVPVTTPVHSRGLDPVLDEFRTYLESVELHPPELPWVSNRTGTWITDEQATDPGYWVDHLRHTVRFSDCVATLAEDPDLIWLEVGPGRTLSSLVRLHPAVKASHPAIPTMRHPEEDIDDAAALLAAEGRVWAAGGDVDPTRHLEGTSPRRIGLPTYPFQTQRYFIAPGAGHAAADEDDTFLSRETDETRWGWKPVWRSEDREDPVDGPQRWLVILDRVGVGDEVVRRLRSRGDDVVVVHLGDSYRALSDHEYVISPELGAVDHESLVRDLVRTSRVPDRIVHLGLLATDDRTFRPGSSFFHRNQELGFQTLVLLAQAWAGAGLQSPLHISVATMGSQRPPGAPEPRWPEQSTVLGPVRVIPRELDGVTVSTFDLDPRELTAAPGAGPDRRRTRGRDDTWARLLDEVTAEVTAPPSADVATIRGDRRWVLDVRRTDLPADGRGPLRTRGVVLVTGGLGGIGLTVAEQLVEDHDARLALLTRSPLPPRPEWDEVVERLGPGHPTTERIERVRSLEAGGAEVEIVTGDVTDRHSLDEAVAAVVRRFGALHGVVHAAGMVDDALLVTKPQQDMEDVLAPKVYGTLALEEATAGHDLDLFVVFSSTSTVTAPIGQVDYVAANAFLNAFAESRHARGDTHVRAIDWGVWSEVGMAATAAGADRAPSDDDHPPVPATHPFFDERHRDDRGVVTLTADWPTATRWGLDEHRTAAGEAVLPGSAYPELARAALAELGVTRPFEIRDLTFVRPLPAPDDGAARVRVVLTPTEEGYRFETSEEVEVQTPSAGDGPAPTRNGWRVTAEATLLLQRLSAPPPVDLGADEQRCPTREATRTHQEDHLRFGPRWGVVERVQRGPGGAMVWLRLDEGFHDDLEHFALHPALFDMGTGSAMSLIEDDTGERLWVPLSYRRILVHGPLPERVVARLRLRPGSSEARGFATFDVTLCAPDGTVAVQIDRFTIKRLDGAFETGLGRPALPGDVEVDRDDTADRKPSLSELALQHNLGQGITRDEGKWAFARALATGLPVVYVTSLDLVRLRRQSDRVAAEQSGAGDDASAAVFGRPQLDSEYLAPRDDVEEALVEMWQDLLGIDQIGVRDDFFALGGHSLIAVRLFARVRRRFSVEFPISVLFEAPTVEAVAALITAAAPAGTDDDGGDDDEGGTVVVPRPRFAHLVAMHPGDGQAATPFFLVAGMFGNVLNLRHLAHQIGSDRPFYGVQARGIYGEEAPHGDFPTMAAAYLEEIRTVQPHGPYLLGGFSGGGLAAYEMAQQLRADGEEVALLVMLDTPLPTNPLLTVAERVALQTDRLRQRGPGYLKEFVVNRIEWEREKRRRSQAPEAPVEGGALHSAVVEAAFYTALERYDLQPYDGVVNLYRPRLTPLHVFGPDRQIDINRRFIYDDNGWGPYCKEVVVTEVPGDHDSMVLEPNVRVLAAHIRTAIDGAEEAGADWSLAPPTDP